MKLKEYLKKTQMSVYELAALAKISPSCLYTYLRGQKPNRLNAFRIEEVTKGAVTSKELRGE